MKKTQLTGLVAVIKTLNWEIPIKKRYPLSLLSDKTFVLIT